MSPCWAPLRAEHMFASVLQASYNVCVTQTLRKLATALRVAPATEPVHFHAGPAGRPYACHDLHCQSPALDPRD